MSDLSEQILRKIETGLKENHSDGVVVIKKSSLEGRSQRLVEDIKKYLEKIGYHSSIREGNKELHILYKSF